MFLDKQKNNEYWVILNLIPGVGALRIKRLLEYFGTPERILSAPASELRKIEGIGREFAGRITRWKETVDVGRELELVEMQGAHVITLGDENYPPLLREIYAPPPVLYVKGDISVNGGRSIAIVGTRHPSFYGRMVTEDLSKKLAMRGFTIVSGLARGIDSAAHKGTLAAKGRTVAVLGCGIDTVYPPENAKLMEEIVNSGAVVTEFPIGTRPDRSNFPRRNRIISGLSLGVVVVEAAKRSGSLITSNFALEQGREVFAVPGKVDSPGSYGTHRLIKDGAKLVQNVDDILEELGMQIRSCAEKSPDAGSGGTQLDLKEDEKKVYELLSSDPCHIDVVCGQINLPVGKVSSILMMLEVKGLISQLPGKQFVKK